MHYFLLHKKKLVLKNQFNNIYYQTFNNNETRSSWFKFQISISNFVQIVVTPKKLMFSTVYLFCKHAGLDVLLRTVEEENAVILNTVHWTLTTI